MLSASTIEFLTKALGEEHELWSSDHISSISAYDTDSFIFIQNKALLQTDIKVLWANWFINSFQDPVNLVDQRYANLYADLISKINELTTPETSLEQKKRLASLIASRIIDTAQHAKKRIRQPWSNEQKKYLLDEAGPKPRCWLTGYQFSDNAIHAFINRDTFTEEKKCEFLDYMTPIGLNGKGSEIQIDHAKPFSSGGMDDISNLRLSCGWANRAKSNKTSLYDAKDNFKKLKHPRLGNVVIPPALWLIRVLALNDVCSICGCSKKENQLFIFPRYLSGQMNPINLKTFCEECHPKRSERLIFHKSLSDQLI